MTVTENKIRLADAFANAQIAADTFAEQTDDAGSCNFDSAFIYANGFQAKTILDAALVAGVNCCQFKRFGRNAFWVGNTNGQGNRRTAMAEAFWKVLDQYKFDGGVYYQMD